MYHHFATKQEVFEAVFVSVVRDTIDYTVRRRSISESPLEDLLAACSVWLSVVRLPDVAKIHLELGPQVLGWQRAREIEAEYSLPLMCASLDQAKAAGEIDTPSVQVTALLLNALLAEAALIAAYGKPRASRSVLEASVRQFVDGMRAG